MGKTLVTLKLTNNRDAILAEVGAIPADQVRRAEVEAIVDTGASITVLPRRSGTWIRICAEPRRRLACFSTSSSNA